MRIDTTRFGTVEFGEDDMVTVRDGLLGFPENHRFLVLSHKEGSPFRWMQSIEDPGLAFLMIDPAEFKPDYAPELPEPVAADLELSAETPRIVYAIVSIPPGNPDGMTANLAGPIVINAEKRIARQIVVEDPQWTTHHRILDELRALGGLSGTESEAAA